MASGRGAGNPHRGLADPRSGPNIARHAARRRSRCLLPNADGGNPGDLVGSRLMLRDLRVVILNRSERKGHLSFTVVSPPFSGRSLLRSAGPRRPADAGPSTCAACVTRYWTVATGTRKVGN